VKEVVKDALDKYVSFISSLEGVIQVYLFGSYAYGSAHDESDIDLMVIIDDNLNRAKMALTISRGLSSIIVPVDVLVNRKSDFYKASNEPTLQKRIKSEGVLLYGAQ